MTFSLINRCSKPQWRMISLKSQPFDFTLQKLVVDYCDAVSSFATERSYLYAIMHM